MLFSFLLPPAGPRTHPRRFEREPPSLRRRLRQKAFIWQMAGDAQARRALRMEPAATGEDGLLHLNLRGVRSPLVLRTEAGNDDRATVWELFFHEPYGGLLPPAYQTVLDLGANVGLTLAYLLYRAAPVERYVGVEADPATFAILRRQVEALGMTGRARLFNVAASDRHGPLRFSTAGESILHGVSETGDLEVPGRTVAEIMDAAEMPEADFMKLDIEGGERQVIADAAKWAGRVKRIAAELHYDMDAAWLRKELRPLGFRVFDVGELFRETVGAIREDVADELPRHLR